MSLELVGDPNAWGADLPSSAARSRGLEVDNVELMRVRVRGLSCACAAAQ
jgi:hypothetical protein